MPTLTNYQSYKLNAYAVVFLPTRVVQLNLTRFGTVFELNAVPTASMSVALGRNVATGLASEIHSIVNELTVTVRTEIYLRVIPGNNSFGFPFETWPIGYFLVFDGVITSTGYTRSRDTVSFNISLSHWLNDLEFSSALTRSSHTLTPEQLNLLAGNRLNQGGVLPVGGQPAFFPHGLAEDFLTPENIAADLWGKGIGPFLQVLCKQDILTEQGDQELGHNLEGLRALQRFEPFAAITDDALNAEYTYGVPLKLPVATLVGADSVATSIATDIGQETFADTSGNSLWHKLVGGYAATYGFKIVPLVSTALVVPQIAGHRDRWQTIYAQEYAAVDANFQVARPIKGVRLFSAGLGAGANGGAGIPATLSGSYNNPNYPGGMIVYQNAPRWASNIVEPSEFGDAAGPFRVRGNGIFPGLGIPPQGAMPADIIFGAGNLLDAYARAVYINLALQGRTGSLQGKLRFDIAPGSTVEIKCVEDKFVQAQLGLGAANSIFAEIQSVGIQVDAESLSASTTFRLANVRTKAENDVDATSIDRHPLYDEGWRGAPLVEDASFVPEQNRVFT